MRASSLAPSECLLPLITGSKKQFVPSEHSLRSFSQSLLRVTLTYTHTHPFTDIETNAHKHLTHYAKAPAAGNTFPTGWQEGEERNSGQLGGGGDGGEESWMDGWVERRCWREEGRRKNEKE